MSDTKDSGLVGMIADQMTKLRDLVSKNDALTSQDKKKYDQICTEYESFKESLELAPGQDAPSKEVPSIIGMAEHAGVNKCEPCL